MVATSLQERFLILELAKMRMSDGGIAEQVHRSPFTVRKWRRKGQRGGALSLASRMGRPRRGALGSYASEMIAKLRQWRAENPGWGTITLHTELALAYPEQKVPSRAGISRWLKQEQLVRRYERHQDLPNSQSQRTASACHEEWEMDARGQEYLEGIGMMCLINVNDVFSKLKIGSFPCWLGERRAIRHPTTSDYQTALRLCFCLCGLPARIAVDHDSIFYDNHSQSPFPTRLHLWLIALGVQLVFGRFACPTDQATTERSHQTWYHQVLEGHSFSSLTSLSLALSQRRSFLNEHLPCSTLGDLPPLVAHPEARFPRRLYRPEREESILDMEAVYAYLANGHWFRKASNIGAVSLGGEVYCLGHDWARAEVSITFDPQDQQLIFTVADARSKRLPIHKLTPQDLMGEFGSLSQLADFQMALPFSWADWLSTYASDLLSGMTL